MKTEITLFNQLKQKVSYFYNKLRFHTLEKKLGRKLAIPIIDSVTAGLYKQTMQIATKKRVYDLLEPACSYKTLVVSMNRFYSLALIIFSRLLKVNRANGHLVKHTDSTDIPVCLLKNADHHRTMRSFASMWHTGKHHYYGLKLHLTTDLQRNILAVKFTSANADDRQAFLQLNRDLLGIFVADSGYVSTKLQQNFYQEGKRILFTKPYKTMKKLATAFQFWLYNTRMLIELNFRNLKLFYGLVTSLPRSADGYLANYIYSLLAYVLA